VFLHEVLERVPTASFTEAGGLPSWRRRAEIAALFDEAVVAHGIDRAQRAHAEHLVWTAYTTSLSLPGGARIDRIASATRIAREMGFVFPVPGGSARSSAAPEHSRPRGFVRGSIDLAFDHRGVTYFVDWKSDTLGSYARAALERHVELHYAGQAQLYALAIAKLLGTRSAEQHEARFGGMLFCFLRGMGEEGRGVWTARPSWDDLVQWEAALQVGWRAEGEGFR
jgi:exodeoxyribonuclease V beta subunit